MSIDQNSTNLNNEKKYTAADFDLSPNKATAVISAAQKFIIPVPNLGDNGEDLINPNTGEQIKDYKGRPIGSKGIVFYNGADRTPQAAPGDGSAVIIINEVTDAEAAKLHKKIAEVASNADELTLSQLKAVLRFAVEELKLCDMYNSTKSFVNEKMSYVNSPKRESDGEIQTACGLMKRDDKDICYAAFVRGAFSLRTGSDTERIHLFTNGGVVLRQGDIIRGVQPEIFIRTYKFADGTSIADPSRDLEWACSAS
ncbi:MAG: hypothetical protein KDD56_07450 [Bdellovibrionales bacterium]|nr:hypothetical protein [Bdellovibrionales bacterium]